MLYRNFATQAELDAQYDVEKSVPDFSVYVRHFVDESKLARHRLRCELDVPFGPTRAEHVDIFPAATRGAPILLFVHGGYWRMLSSKEFSCVALGPVAAGVTVVNVNYALCPAVGIDEISRQARAAVAWTYRNADRFGGDRDRIHMTGHSAGGHLTAMCLNTDWAGDYGLPSDIIKSAMPISGLFDLTPIRYTLMQPLLQFDGDQVERNSPIRHVARNPVPMLISYGGDEPGEFMRQSRDYARAWEMAGNRADVWEQPGANHFTAIYGFEDPKSDLCRRLFRLMGVTAER